MLDLIYGIENVSFFDSIWAIIHFGSGILTGLGLILIFKYLKKDLTGLKYSRYGFSLLLIWEYFELSLRFMDKYNLKLVDYITIVLPRSFVEIETVINIASDLILGSLGLFLIYRYWRIKNVESA